MFHGLSLLGALTNGPSVLSIPVTTEPSPLDWAHGRERQVKNLPGSTQPEAIVSPTLQPTEQRDGELQFHHL